MHQRSLFISRFVLATLAASVFVAPTFAHAASCVWRVTDAKAPFYLVGSIHALSQKDYPLPPSYEQALHDSERLLFEFDPKQDKALSAQLEAAGTYPKGQDIRNKITPTLLNWLRTHTKYVNRQYDDRNKRFEVQVAGFDKAMSYKPWYLAMHYGVPGFSDVSHSWGVDAYLGRRARQMGKQVAGLESVPEHVAVLGGLSDMDSQILLLDRIVYANQTAAEYNRVRAAWKRGDTAGLWASDGRLRKEAFWIEDRLLGTRNRRWLPRIEAELRTGKPTAIVAGALHFSGPNSIVEMLRHHGHTVVQL
jgi:uncharacterized protein YbaP (TraB family)